MNYAYFGELVLSRNWILWLLFAYFILPFTVYLFVPFFIHRKSVLNKKSVSIFVLGDIGHSPRMCYHARSFASLGFAVNLCGYLESEPPQGIIEDVNIDIFPIQAIQNRRNLPYLLFAITKAVLQIFSLFELCYLLSGSQYYMVQNPPSMPLVAVLVIFIKLFSPRSKLIIDWHNLNYSILNLRFQNVRHPLVQLMKSYEKFFSRFSWLNITVTEQMKHYLATDFGVKSDRILAFHDRPGPQFSPLSQEKIKQVFAEHELFTSVPEIEQYKVLVTATSFTPDEDLGILLECLKIYHDSSSDATPPIFVLVTGKGPLKSQFLKCVEGLGFLSRVIVKSAWLSAEEYPLLLGVADLAVSLHTSLSGIDLPMKIVDFFGVGVPVVTLSFPAIGELVKDGVNGLVVSENITKSVPGDLYKLVALILGDDSRLAKLKLGAMSESKQRWNENWMQVLAPVVEG
ncbi:putative chitobiosyldiphosphodolichol beta-mannosyltransferase [Metschnikowia bicuspidata var. bicuspidata NRRL YB-4993]|uniref:Chitobiosyldiphosphodolichol beta-mannosyltransferase n=1 Tax=Metschnikowia bicuspidata var. bicuspidata NRRL YB-4993 TaxID=869754 RepID=A0A1A0HFW1_9ASCO|nr:putative chitobiosyldiphosphodolichol beta-mannosyltransferase [Metschnikowia bicuspidata var. bicuspidata NRRL YB-4993]OBA22743.1 putative chitobiosyldiphosphodolichol beta-mannosyltransferase [Metschnikowia bicuspidata var. bicuspidata NRRL YB-4993]